MRPKLFGQFPHKVRCLFNRILTIAVSLVTPNSKTRGFPSNNKSRLLMKYRQFPQATPRATITTLNTLSTNLNKLFAGCRKQQQQVFGFGRSSSVLNFFVGYLVLFNLNLWCVLNFLFCWLVVNSFLLLLLVPFLLLEIHRQSSQATPRATTTTPTFRDRKTQPTEFYPPNFGRESEANRLVGNCLFFLAQ